jgi:hypothetical protein
MNAAQRRIGNHDHDKIQPLSRGSQSGPRFLQLCPLLFGCFVIVLAPESTHVTPPHHTDGGFLKQCARLCALGVWWCHTAARSGNVMCESFVSISCRPNSTCVFRSWPFVPIFTSCFACKWGPLHTRERSVRPKVALCHPPTAPLQQLLAC